MNSRITPCDCGFGDGFYHYEHDGTHEYNPDKSIEEATQDYFDDRSPEFYFYIKLGGNKITLVNNRTSATKNFSLSKFDDVKSAFSEMAKISIYESRQMDLFPYLFKQRKV